MITFTMIVTIWVGAETHRLNVWTSERFNGPGACERAMEEAADEVRFYAAAIEGARLEIARQCVTLETRPA